MTEIEMMTNLKNIKENSNDTVTSNIAELYYNFLNTNISTTKNNLNEIMNFIKSDNN